MATLSNFAHEILDVVKKLMHFYKTVGLWDDYTFGYKGLNVVAGNDKMLDSLILHLEEIKVILDRLYVERTSRTTLDKEVLKLIDSSDDSINNKQFSSLNEETPNHGTNETRNSKSESYQPLNPQNLPNMPIPYYYFQPGGMSRNDLLQTNLAQNNLISNHVTQQTNYSVVDNNSLPRIYHLTNDRSLNQEKHLVESHFLGAAELESEHVSKHQEKGNKENHNGNATAPSNTSENVALFSTSRNDKKITEIFVESTEKLNYDLFQALNVNNGMPINLLKNENSSEKSSVINEENRLGEADSEFKCQTCNKVLSSKAALDGHRIIHSGKQSFCCEHCGKLFSSKRNLISHLTRYHQLELDKVFSCSQCGKLFGRKCTLSLHLATHARVKPYSCHICYKTFTQKCTRNVHILTHKGSYDYSCAECQRKFPTKYKLNFHLKTHQTQFSCLLCSTAFTNEDSLNEHYNSHKESILVNGENNIETETPLKCPHCDILFSSPKTFSEHKKAAHPNVKDLFICSDITCKARVKSFLEKHMLARHNRRHHNANRKVMQCDLCGAQFLEKPSLKHHVERHHLSFELLFHKCPICLKQFTLRAKLRRHLKTHAEEPQFKCEKCGKRFYRSDALKQHLSTHEITSTTCEICEKKFKTEECLKLHMSNHLNADRTCMHCGKTFSSKLALDKHIAMLNKNFEFCCEVCGKGFVRKNHFKSHLQTHSTTTFYKCSVCAKGFKSESYCKKHIKRSHSEGSCLEMSTINATLFEYR